MPKYLIKFKHVLEKEYETIIIAENREEAADLFEEAPFEVGTKPQQLREYDLDIERLTIKEI